MTAADGVAASLPLRRILSALAKAALSGLLIALILWRVPLAKAFDGLASLSFAAILAALVLTFAFPAIAALRWKRALHRLGTQVPWVPLLADTLVSSTYNMLLPTQIGGDVVRALRCARRASRPSHAWSSALFERLVGLVALALLAVPGLAMAPGARPQITLAVAAFASLAGILVFAAPAPFRFAARLIAKRSQSVANLGSHLAEDLSGPLATLSARLEMLAWSLLYQAVGLGLLAVVVLDWGRPDLCWAILGAVPLALVLTLLPVSIAGLGVRESLFVVLLGQFGVPSDRALSLALIWLASALLLALAGAVVVLLEASRGARAVDASAPDLRSGGES